MGIEKKSEQNICIAKILSPHGVRGLVKVAFYTDDPERLISSTKIFNKQQTKEFALRIKSQHKESFIASILGIEDRNQSEELKGTELYITRDSLPELDEENFYINDLLGMSVQNSSGEIVGTIANFYNFGAGDIIEIKSAKDQKTQCYSFTKENFPIVDLSLKTVTISKD